ncbi:MAG: hypothetical protein K2M91_05555 [Lachnospiraceae bacterium]|nr:hypothetical protein [Lachnospiraceae bacterium]
MCGKVEMAKRKYIFLSIIIGISGISLMGCRRDAVSYLTEEEAGIFGTDSIENSMAEADTDTALSENDLTETEASEQGQSENETEVISERTPQLPNTGRKLDDFVPEGWSILDSVELDFNEDGIMDYVGVLETFSAEYQNYPRILFGIASDGMDEYRLDFQDINLIRTRDEGGVFGDPYEPLTVDGLSFTTHAYGGSAWRWSEDNTYTYQENIWRLTSSEDSYGYYEYTTCL